MTFLMILKILLSVLIVPFGMGLILFRKNENILMALPYGYIVEWAMFVAVSIPLIILQKPFSMMYSASVIAEGILCVIGILFFAFKTRSAEKKQFLPLSRSEMVYLGLFLAIVFFQLFKAAFFSYEDGDDAYYVAVSQVVDMENVPYSVDPYLGRPISVNYRYALAPFPVFASVISVFSGANASMVSHLVLPLVLIPITYVIYNEISKLLFGEDREKRYMFLTLTAVYEMFSAVSTSTAGRFLLTRARQGKEALANIIIPLLFLVILRVVKKSGEYSFLDWVTLFATCLAASLTSLFGNILAPLMIFFLFVYYLVKNKKLGCALWLAASIVPNIISVLLYVKLS